MVAISRWAADAAAAWRYGPAMDTHCRDIDAPLRVAALYRFARFEDFASLREPLDRLCRKQGIRGTLLLAAEGINGTIAGTPEGIDTVLAHIRALPDCADLDVKLSSASVMPFHRMKVRLKREIVTMGQPDIDPRASVGTYVEAQDWNALISDPQTIVIDTRNDYEVAVGTFEGAIDPRTPSFRDFPEWFRQERERLLGGGKPPRVAMFCTGGIRCEKSTAFLKQEGIEDVYHLKGGILKYLETVPEEQSLWRGECFVFDQRVTIGHGLVEGSYSLCHACRRPVSAEGATSPLYEEGVSCPACHGERTEEQRESYRERQRQEALAAARGEAHVGARFEQVQAEQRNDRGA
ncbi:rhodanese domain-containing protein [Novosphingobium sp. PY1]|nr:rhodanese domain-containing protein [Novosphingobium sp. PY1]